MENISIDRGRELHVSHLLINSLLACGILSALLYVVMNIVTVILYPGYNVVSQTVSELSAIGSPARAAWVPLGMIYNLLVIAFGTGIWMSTKQNRRLRIVGVIFIVDGFFTFFWPPMHTREVLAAGGGTIEDILHIVWTAVHIPLVLLCMGYGAFAFGKKFLVYSIISIIILIIAGIMTGIDGPKISQNLPTPWIGIWERITIGVYMAWMIVLAILLIGKKNQSAASK